MYLLCFKQLENDEEEMTITCKLNRMTKEIHYCSYHSLVGGVRKSQSISDLLELQNADSQDHFVVSFEDLTFMQQKVRFILNGESS